MGKMNQENYDVSWQNFSDHFQEMLNNMMTSSELSDVTLVCDDKIELKAHKIILSSCSSVFKNILSDHHMENSSKMYLSEIEHTEMQSILEFMYLGVATIPQNRFSYFLDVAKSFEIEEIINDTYLNNGNLGSADLREQMKDQTEFKAEQMFKNADENTKVVGKRNSPTFFPDEDGKYCCNQCDMKFTKRNNLYYHIQAKHEGKKFSCNKCDHQFTTKHSLRIHIQSKHEGLKYGCTSCDYQATQQGNLRNHIKSVHEGVKYKCKKCHQQFSAQSALNLHIQAKHEGLMYACDRCDYQSNYTTSLNKHMMKLH